MAIEKVVNVKVVDNVESTTKNVANLKTQLRQAQNEVNELSAKFGATSTQAVEAAKRAAELKDAIGDAKALTDAFNPDAKFKALTSTLGGVAGGFAAVQGAVGLLGSESQSVEKAILKVQSAMAISQGVQAIGESVDSFRQLGAVVRSTTIFQKALTAATAIQTFVMNGATLAAKLLRGALISTGVGALVVGVGLLIANFDKVKKVVMNLVPGLAIMGDVVMGIVNAVTDFVGVTSEAEREAERAKTNAEKRSKDIDRILKEDGSRYSESAKKKMAIEKQLQDDIAEGLYNETKLRKEAAFAIAQINKENADNAEKKRKEEQDKRNDESKKRAEDAKKAKEEQDKKDKEEKERLEKQYQDFEEFQSNIRGSKEAQNKIDAENLELQLEELNNISDNFYNQNVESAIQKDALDKELATAEIERQKAVNDAKIDLARNTLNLVAEIAGEGSDIAKGVAVAQATISGIEGTQNAFTTASKSPITTLFPAYPFIQAGLAGAFSALQIKKIISTPKTGGGSSSASVGGGGSAPAPPQFNIVGQSQTNQLAQTIAGKQQQPIEAFVVSSAVTTSQALDRNRVKTATFGG
jgi:hypothetical protein